MLLAGIPRIPHLVRRRAPPAVAAGPCKELGGAPGYGPGHGGLEAAHSQGPQPCRGRATERRLLWCSGCVEELGGTLRRGHGGA